MEIANDYVKITLTNKIVVTPYSSENIRYELEDVFYNSDGSKYVICERKNIQVAKLRLIQPLIDKFQNIVDNNTKALNALKQL